LKPRECLLDSIAGYLVQQVLANTAGAVEF
jgi:hypothetical protein